MCHYSAIVKEQDFEIIGKITNWLLSCEILNQNEKKCFNDVFNILLVAILKLWYMHHT